MLWSGLDTVSTTSDHMCTVTGRRANSQFVSEERLAGMAKMFTDMGGHPDTFNQLRTILKRDGRLFVITPEMRDMFCKAIKDGLADMTPEAKKIMLQNMSVSLKQTWRTGFKVDGTPSKLGTAEHRANMSAAWTPVRKEEHNANMIAAWTPGKKAEQRATTSASWTSGKKVDGTPSKLGSAEHRAKTSATLTGRMKVHGPCTWCKNTKTHVPPSHTTKSGWFNGPTGVVCSRCKPDPRRRPGGEPPPSRKDK